jgi:hypothetical protein
MKKHDEISRFLIKEQPAHLQYSPTRLQPILAKAGKPNIDVNRLQEILKGVAVLNEMIPIDSPEHWQATVRALDDSVDAILPHLTIPWTPSFQ